MNQITDDRQQQCLEKFFAKEKTWYPDYFGCKFAAYMMFFCGIIGWLFPYQAEWVSIHESIKTYGIYTMIYLLGFSFYSQMFTSYKGSKRNRNLGEILQNLPVSSVQIAIFKAKKTLKICGRIAVIAAAGQTFFAIVALHTFSIGNILIPLAVLYVLPAGICAVEIAVELWKGQTPVRLKKADRCLPRTFIYKLCGFLRSFIDNINAGTYKKQCGNTAKAQRIFFAKQDSG